jgi:hypothetical protein
VRGAAKDENAGLMVGIAGDMPDGKHQPEAAVVFRRIDDPTPGSARQLPTVWILLE